MAEVELNGGGNFPLERMSLKQSKTTADFLPWSEMIVLVQKLERDGKLTLALLVAIGSYTGLRISDLLSLKWKQLLSREYLEVSEKKTGKHRKIKLNKELMELLPRLYHKSSASPEDQVLMNPKTRKPFTVQYINRQLKKLRFKYRLPIKRFSTHTLRKTFGRHIWENSGYSEKAITILSEIFNHSSFRITRRYLGINEEDIDQIYDLL